MLVDDITIRVSAGHGGKGAVAFNKNLMSLGPAGGSGGNGASIYGQGVSDLAALRQFRFSKDVKAKSGKDGRGQFVDGRRGEELILKLPVGTVIHFPHGLKEINKVGEVILLARGGKGGRGNFHFRSSINTSPKEFEFGTPGEKFEIRLELKLIADIGFVGLPNVGKSSLLNVLTRSQARVANYPFTTLEPNLGVYEDLILADIPGLIEGASEGKGLGTKFLRHVERTNVLFHFIAADSFDHLKDYETIRKELGTYNEELLHKPEYIFISRADTVMESQLEGIMKKFAKLDRPVQAITILEDKSVERVRVVLNDLNKAKHAV
ncbi:MAG: GTPase ObgE [Patescibacteria group bacterium]